MKAGLTRAICACMLAAAAATGAACGKREAQQQTADADMAAAPPPAASAAPVPAPTTPMTSQSLRIVSVQVLGSTGNRAGTTLVSAAQPIRIEVESNGLGEGDVMDARLIDMGKGREVARRQHSWNPRDTRATLELSGADGHWPAGPYLIQLNLAGIAVDETDLQVE